MAKAVTRRWIVTVAILRNPLGVEVSRQGEFTSLFVNLVPPPP